MRSPSTLPPPKLRSPGHSRSRSRWAASLASPVQPSRYSTLAHLSFHPLFQQPGQTQIDLSFLPSGLEEDNIRLEAHGAFSHSVTIREPFACSPTQGQTPRSTFQPTDTYLLGLLAVDVICKDIASDDDNNFGHLSLEEAERQLREERAKVEVLSTQGTSSRSLSLRISSDP